MSLVVTVEDLSTTVVGSETVVNVTVGELGPQGPPGDPGEALDLKADIASTVMHGDSAGGVLGGTFPHDLVFADPAPASAADIEAIDGRLDVLESDTGWVLPTLASADITVRDATDHKGLRVKGGIFYWKLSLNVASPAANKDLFTIPLAMRFPTGAGQHFHNFTGTIYVLADGRVRTATSQAVVMSNAAIPVD